MATVQFLDGLHNFSGVELLITGGWPVSLGTKYDPILPNRNPKRYIAVENTIWIGT